MPFDTSQSAYIELRNIVAEKTGGLVAWVGSGLSVSGGLPTWPHLIEKLIDAMENKATSLNDEDAFDLLRIASLVRGEIDYWVAFEIALKALGSSSYLSVVRRALAPRTDITLPRYYRDIWALGFSGVLSVNMDRLATRAYIEANPNQTPIEFDGSRAGSLTHVLRSPRRFITNLHGTVEDSSSWILTKTQMRNLLRNEGYKTFIRTCVSSNTVLFLGVSADDIAVGGHFEALSDLGIDVGPHFWVTDRRDSATDRWAERSGIRVIRYNAHGDDHHELDELFDDLIRYMPVDDNAPPVFIPDTIQTQTILPPPHQLAKEDSETIRAVLNERAQRILGNDSGQQYDEFDEFCKQYDEPIYRAWYTTSEEGENSLLGYKLLQEIARGAFGRVYRSLTEDGEQVAIKVLREDVRREPGLMQCFRRGVRSMRILSDHDVDGMVPYRSASEIPAFVVMDWVEGPDLREAVSARRLNDWAGILRVGVDLAAIINSAHRLPERVLHRDLRPSNVMLEGFDVLDEWGVVVLDFDLSWHKGATEMTVIQHAAAMVGYLAPEQLAPDSHISTRHASVDSFGLGMTLFFMIARHDPIPAQHRHEHWEHDVQAAARRTPSLSWRSVPARFARTIVHATKDAQFDRWDVTQIEKELRRLSEATLDPSSVESAELVSEELAIRSDYARRNTYGTTLNIQRSPDHLLV